VLVSVYVLVSVRVAERTNCECMIDHARAPQSCMLASAVNWCLQQRAAGVVVATARADQ
jgi:hypothetical protein